MKYKTLTAILLSCALLTPAVNFAAAKAATAAEQGTRTSKADLQTSVDINQADAKLLATLKGIGPKKAAAIIAYRTKNGDFKSVGDLLQVPGMSQRILDANQARLTVG